MKYLALLILVSLSTLSSAHSMSPGFKTEWSATSVHEKSYTLKNDYDHPSVFTIQVFNKDWTPASGWKVEKEQYKLLPNSKTQVKVRFKVEKHRKVIVCSTLTEIGKYYEKASIISRVCSRLIINGFGKQL